MKNAFSDTWTARCLLYSTLSVLLLLCGCAHSSATAERDNNAAKNIQQAQAADPTRAFIGVSEILDAPDRHVNQRITISGWVDNLQLREVDKDLLLLNLELKGLAIPMAQETTTVAPKVHLKAQLDTVGELFASASESPSAADIEPAQCEVMAYKLKSNASRLRALAHFLRANSEEDLSVAVDRIATAYTEISEAFAAFSHIGQKTPAGTLEMPQAPTDTPRLLAPDESSSSFQTLIAQAQSQLAELAESLVDGRYHMVNHELSLEVTRSPEKANYSLLSVSELLDAEGWEHRAEQDFDNEKNLRSLSRAFSRLGAGMASLNDGFVDMGEKLTLAVVPAPVAPEVPTLRCAFMGYNNRVLEDCKTKVEQFGRHRPIAIHGRLNRGNLREELDQLWFEVDAIEIDDMVINVAYGNDSTTARNLHSMYDWFKEIDN